MVVEEQLAAAVIFGALGYTVEVWHLSTPAMHGAGSRVRTGAQDDVWLELGFSRAALPLRR